ncbi:MAG: Chromate transport protein ChrA [Hyphomicrobiales bacterium]|nr:Chromate transport protein ChrA [Hyphomicrobiales bacterium]
MRDDHLLSLFVVMAPLSLASIGGATSIYAPMQHDVVDVHGWVTAREFLDLLAISRFIPGPSSILGAFVGMKVAGLAGALVAMVALYLPSSALCYAVGAVWSRHRGKPWVMAIEQGLGPVAAGLIMAGVLSLFQLTGGDPLSAAVILGVAGALTWRRSLHPFALLALGALAFEAAWLLGVGAH